MRRLAVPALLALALAGCADLPYEAVPAPPAPERPAVVVDIDGTLTPGTLSMFEARPAAARALRTYAAKGYDIVYLTARSPFLQAGIPAWLEEHGFPTGSLHTARIIGDWLHVARFKTNVLDDYRALGWRLSYAYGDSATDFAAYAAAGIPPDHVFALRRHGAQVCQRGVYRRCLDGWKEQLSFIEQDVPSAVAGR